MKYKKYKVKPPPNESIPSELILQKANLEFFNKKPSKIKIKPSTNMLEGNFNNKDYNLNIKISNFRTVMIASLLVFLLWVVWILQNEPILVLAFSLVVVYLLYYFAKNCLEFSS